MLFTEGQMVKKGQLLATIDPRPFEIALQQAIGARQRDEAQLESAQVQLQRYQTLLGQDSIARQDVDTQAALVKQLEGTVAIDRANEGTARLNLGYTRIVAPVAGRVGLRPIDTGNYIGAGDATGVARDHAARADRRRVRRAAGPRARDPGARRAPAPGCRSPRSTARAPRKLDDGVFSTLDNQIDTQTGTVQGEGALRQRRRGAVPEPVRQRAAAAAHRSTTRSSCR